MKISCIAGPAEVEVAIGEAQLFVGLGAVHLERRRRRRVVDHQLAGADLDPAGLELGVLLAVQPRSDVPLMPTTYSLRSSRARACSSAPASGSKTTWVMPIAVAQVDEEQAAEVAPGVDPAVEHDVLPDMLGRQFAASMSSFQ